MVLEKARQAIEEREHEYKRDDLVGVAYGAEFERFERAVDGGEAVDGHG